MFPFFYSALDDLQPHTRYQARGKPMLCIGKRVNLRRMRD
jgi:hypothetical protein